MVSKHLINISIIYFQLQEEEAELEKCVYYILSEEKKAGAPQMRDVAFFPAIELPQSKLDPVPWFSSLEKCFSIWEGTS